MSKKHQIEQNGFVSKSVDHFNEIEHLCKKKVE